MRIQVWRPCRWVQAHLDTDRCEVADATSFQQCVFTWVPPADVFDCLTNDEAAQKLRTVLVADLAPNRPVNQRTIERLDAVLQTIDGIVEAGDASWCPAPLGERTSDPAPSTSVHPLFVLRHATEWIRDCFRGAPGANVTVR